VLSGRSLCVGLIIRPEESYGVCCVECDCEALTMRRPWPSRDCCNIEKKMLLWYVITEFRKNLLYLQLPADSSALNVVTRSKVIYFSRHIRGIHPCYFRNIRIWPVRGQKIVQARDEYKSALCQVLSL
jgi:hypothetical protein